MKKILSILTGAVLLIVIIFGSLNQINTPINNGHLNKQELGGELQDFPKDQEQTAKEEIISEENSAKPIENKENSSVATVNAEKIQPTVKLTVSTDYGRKILFNKQVPLKDGETILSLLEQNLEIEKAYGGGFVNSIAGISSGYGKNNERMDWFFWVNGVMGNVGGSQYQVLPGDKVWWDYHLWSDSAFIPNVIGSFPEPLLQGYKGTSTQTVVLTSDRFLDLARKIDSKLRAKGINSTLQTELDNIEDKAVLAIGTWDELGKIDLISGYNRNPKRTGLFVNFGDDGFSVLNDKGEKVKQFNQAGAIVCLGNSLGDRTPLWLITATDDEMLAFTVNILLNETGVLENKIGLITDGNKVFGLPWEG